MDHVAIMKKSWGLTEKILSGEKKIESRWYMARCAPWDRIKEGETVYFKDSGEPVKIKAKVGKVLQFADLNSAKVGEILEKYGEEDGLEVIKSQEPSVDIVFSSTSSEKTVPTRSLDTLAAWKLFKNKSYCILIFLKNPIRIKPFDIDKTGFGMMSAWITVKNIKQIRNTIQTGKMINMPARKISLKNTK